MEGAAPSASFESLPSVGAGPRALPGAVCGAGTPPPGSGTGGWVEESARGRWGGGRGASRHALPCPARVTAPAGWGLSTARAPLSAPAPVEPGGQRCPRLSAPRSWPRRPGSRRRGLRRGRRHDRRPAPTRLQPEGSVRAPGALLPGSAGGTGEQAAPQHGRPTLGPGAQQAAPSKGASGNGLGGSGWAGGRLPTPSLLELHYSPCLIVESWDGGWGMCVWLLKRP